MLCNQDEANKSLLRCCYSQCRQDPKSFPRLEGAAETNSCQDDTDRPPKIKGSSLHPREMVELCGNVEAEVSPQDSNLVSISFVQAPICALVGP